MQRRQNQGEKETKGEVEVFLDKVEGWEENREIRHKIFRAPSVGKYVLVKDSFTCYFPVRKKSHIPAIRYLLVEF